MTRLTLRVDGGARGNPGPAAAGFVLQGPAGEHVAAGGRCLGVTTNNVAEYEALIWGVETALAHGATELDIFADSQLVVRQIEGKYKVKHPNMKPLHLKAVTLLSRMSRWSITHVLRAENVSADALVNEALDTGMQTGDAPWPADCESPTLF